MKRLLTLMCILCTYSSSLHSQTDCGLSQSNAELNINNIQAGIPQSGTLWQYGNYFAPNDGSGISAIFAGGLWITGTRQDGTIKVVAGQYSSSGGSYHPGPLNPDTGERYPNGCEDWDKHFTIFQSEKTAHQSDFADNSTIDNPLSNIFAWPGRNNPHFSEYNGFTLPVDVDLAPFIDLNGDNIYDPASGDYPDTKGDQAIWWIFNPKGDDPVKIEIQAMAYAFQCSVPAVNNTTFYDFKLVHRGTESLTDFNFALWTDADLGCYTDDYIGFNEEKQMQFYYNVDNQDGSVGTDCGGILTYGEEIPMLGIKLMSDSDDLGVTSFTYYNSPSQGNPLEATSDPTSIIEYQNYMRGYWRDGSPFTVGGSGYGGDIATSFAFTGDPADPDGWSMCSAASSNSPEYDRRTVMSTGGGTINPDEVKEYSYAVLFVPDVPHPCPSLDMLVAAADAIENFDCVVSSISEPNFAEEIGLQVSPNPARENFTISIDAEDILLNRVEIINLAGNILQQRNKVDARNLTFDVANLTAGMYFVKVTTDAGKIAVRKLVVQ